MIEYDARPERAVLVAVLAQGADEERELAEMRELLRTAQVDIVATCVQHRATIHPRTYVGSGKLEGAARSSPRSSRPRSSSPRTSSRRASSACSRTSSACASSTARA